MSDEAGGGVKTERRPTIFVVSRHAEMRRVLDRELNKRYGEDYDVTVATSPTDGMEVLERLRADSVPVAMILAAFLLLIRSA